jgi:hypothetical protein
MRSAVLVLLAILTAAPSLSGQYTVKRLVFRNNGPYTQAQLEASAALKPGEHIGAKQMGEASQRLMDTGAFDDIEVTLNGPVASIDVIFKLKPADPASFLPVTYQNLVWLSDDERDVGVRQRVPLFTGRIPAAGTMQTSVQQALQEMLAAKGVATTVEAEQRSTSAAKPTPFVLYRVTTPSVTLDNVKLTGISIDFRDRENQALRNMVGQPYVFGSGSDLAARLLQPLRNAGYIDAKIEHLQLTPAPAIDGIVRVTATGDALTGDSYRVGSVEWAGSPLFSAEDFAKANKLHAGDVASDTLLKQSYEPLTIAYLKQGYSDASIDTKASRDEAAHTVSYTIKVTPGEVYHVGSVSAVGLDPKARADFDAAWSMHPGDVYDATYTGRFLGSGKIPSLQPYSAGINASANPVTHLADVLLTFVPVPR